MSKVLIKQKKDYLRKDGTCSFYAQVFLQGKIVKLPIDMYLETSFYDEKNQTVKESHPDAISLNMMLDQVRTDIFEIRKRFMLKKKELTPDLLVAEYTGFGGSGDFLGWMFKEIDNRRGEISQGTYNHHKAVASKLKQFKHSILFNDITPDLVSRFQVFLRDKLLNNQSTIGAAMKVLKTYIKIALRRELLESNPFEFIKIRKGKPSLVYLKEQERNKMMEVFKDPDAPERYKKVLHPFLFSCFTGLRISDVKRLRWDHFAEDTIYIMPYKTQRTSGETVVIPLGQTALWLIDQAQRRPKDPYVFQMISDQKNNEYLKEIAGKLGIRKSLHFHVARHTFATLFYEKTNDLATLQKLLGHAAITQTMVYAHVSDQLRRDQMKVFDF